MAFIMDDILFINKTLSFSPWQFTKVGACEVRIETDEKAEEKITVNIAQLWGGRKADVIISSPDKSATYRADYNIGLLQAIAAVMDGSPKWDSFIGAMLALGALEYEYHV